MLRAQPQPENTSFEDWTNVGQATEEPVNWSSLKTSDGGALINALVPQLCWRSADAHTGQYSVNLRTVNSAIGAANGLLTNGRVHAELAVENSYMYTVQNDAQWNTPLTGRPDSLVGWFKASPQPGDRANVGALLHVDEGRLPAFGTEANWVAGLSWKAPSAAIAEWTRFSEPFLYLSSADPEWILFILTAGDSAGSQVGTEAWFDDLALIYNVQCALDAQSVVPGQPFIVDYSTGGIPVGTVTFTAELSDAGGSFAAPVPIGSIATGNAAGSIACIVPEGIAAGMDYRIRVVGDSPFYAPVGCPVVIESSTAIAGADPIVPDIRVRRGQLVIRSERPGFFELYTPDGRLLRNGGLGRGVNLIAMDAPAGIALVRVNDGLRTFHQRVWLD